MDAFTLHIVTAIQQGHKILLSILGSRLQPTNDVLLANSAVVHLKYCCKAHVFDIAADLVRTNVHI
jgi:hypothetical protein